MKRAGIIAAAEGPFPGALIDRINGLDAGVVADMLVVGHVPGDFTTGCDVIVDRVSHWNRFFRAYLKAAVIGGTYVINNPFAVALDDKFVECAATRSDTYKIPTTILIPPRSYPVGAKPDDLKNVKFPLDWEQMVETIGMPAYLKPFDGHGWRHVTKVANLDELITAYNRSGERIMILQRMIEYEHYVRCLVVGRKYVLPIKYDPGSRSYEVSHRHMDDKLGARVNRAAIEVCELVGYDFNSVEFAVSNGKLYAIDFMNPIPDMKPRNITGHYFEWAVEHLARVVVECAHGQLEQPQPFWKTDSSPEKTER